MEEIKILEKLLPFIRFTIEPNNYIYSNDIILNVHYDITRPETGWYIFKWKGSNYSWEDFKEVLICYLIIHGRN